MYKKLLTAFTLLLATVFGYAQTPNYYLFEQKNAPYTELVNDTALQAAFLSSGDIWMHELAGETFTMFDRKYVLDNVKTHIVFSNNGFVRFEDDSSFIVLDAAFTFIDSIDNTTRLSYIIEGTPGNLILKMQWKNLALKNGPAGNFVNYQVWLYQKTGVFEIYYGPSSANNSSGYTTANGPNIGLFYSNKSFSKMHEKIWINGSPGSYVIDSARNTQFRAVGGVPPANTMFRFVPKKVAANVGGIKAAGEVQVFPNPARTYITLRGAGLGNGGKAVLYDISGKQVLAYELGRTNGEQNMPISNVPAGTYELKLSLHDREHVYKINIVH